MTLDIPIEKSIRLLPAQQVALKRLGILTVRDLLYYIPVRYTDISRIKAIKDALEGEQITISGTIRDLQTKKSFKSGIPMATGTVEDLSGKMRIIWFRQAYLAKMITEGSTVQLTGKVASDSKGLYLGNPEVEEKNALPIDVSSSLFSDGKVKVQFGFPIYRETRGITSRFIYHAVQKVIASGAIENLTDAIPTEIREKYNLPNLATALRAIHAPKTPRDAEAARKRLLFDELFLIQLARQKARAKLLEEPAYQIDISEDTMGEFTNRFPFELTSGQESVIRNIMADLKKPHPMARLLEGDVGSGKTAVAASVAYATVMTQPFDKAKGKPQGFGNVQVAYMAPTEILATQLFENFITYFRHLPIQIGLITGSGCRKYPSKTAQMQELANRAAHREAAPATKWWTDISRTQLLKWVANGEIPILVGTHALIQKSVKFKHLGLVIIDEQHRFGTNQRGKLAKKEGFAPHLLSMTATPIPRTLALTFYGDLDLSLLEEMPHGRKPVETKVIPEGKRDECYTSIIEKLHEGRQAYIICPRIDEPDPDKEQALQAKSVKAEAERLGKTVFKNFRIDILHSKMTKEKKEETMQAFLAHEIDILVATSVVEVGVNVPNATSIIIEGAERFGLAQLHQLRGRVIRSSHQAYCYLFTESKGKVTEDRLKAFIKAKNGFELAELDLTLRGAGELAGGKQWGISDMGMEAIKNLKMVTAAREEARALVAQDPDLKNYPLLSQIISSPKYELHFE